MTLTVLWIGINALVILLLYLKLSREIRNAISYDHVLDEVRRDVEDLIVQINQATERNISLVEDRIKKINSLLALADKRITLLERDTIPRYTEIKRPVIPDVAQARSNQKVSKKEQVLELHRNGFSSGIIAAKAGISIGEVELIISLSSGKEERYP